MISLVKPDKKYYHSFINAIQSIDCVENGGIFNLYYTIKPSTSLDGFIAFVDELCSIENQHHFWIIYENEYAGRIALYDAKPNDSIRLSYQVSPTMRGKGVASIAMSLAKDKAKDFGYNSINIICEPQNIPSQKVILKNGGEILETTAEKIYYKIKL